MSLQFQFAFFIIWDLNVDSLFPWFCCYLFWWLAKKVENFICFCHAAHMLASNQIRLTLLDYNENNCVSKSHLIKHQVSSQFMYSQCAMTLKSKPNWSQLRRNSELFYSAGSWKGKIGKGKRDGKRYKKGKQTC